MSTDKIPRISEVLPSEAWSMLENNTDVVLIDVRTHAEWNFVGIPDMTGLQNLFLTVEWAQLPGMSVNPSFIDTVMQQLGAQTPTALLFLCRSGVRSLSAARAMATHLETDDGRKVDCVNVTHGFEGDTNEARHRGGVNGWKAAGLPWRQS